MKALVTGGAGFIGGHLSAVLLAEGHEVLAVDDLSTGDPETVVELVDRPGYEFVKGSILDEPLMDRLAAQVDTVFHLAAAVGVRFIMQRPIDALRTNLHGTEVVLECADRHGVRALVTSSSEVYGKNAAARLAEDQDRIAGSPLTTRWSYAEAKALDETLAFLYWRDRAVPAVIVRLFNVAGPRQTGRYGMVIPRFVDQALQDEPLTIFGDGRQTRCFCHVRDAVDGLIALIDNPAAYGGVYNIGRPEEVSIKYLAERVIRLSDAAGEMRHVPYDEAYGDGYEDIRRRVPDISRARALVGFDPKLGLDEIIMSVIADRLAKAAPGGQRAVPEEAEGVR